MGAFNPVDHNLTISEIINKIGLQLYKPPLSLLRPKLRSLPEELRILILLFDFDSEVHINGILGFLENPTGFYLLDTIQALDLISAHYTADILHSIDEIMQQYGVTFTNLRGDFENSQLYEITTFSQLHGDQSIEMSAQIEKEAQKLYIYDRTAENPFELLTTYLETRKNRLISAFEDVFKYL